MTSVKYKIPMRKLGENGPEVSLMGFGTWQLGGPFIVGGRTGGLPHFDHCKYVSLLETAMDFGINFYETSSAYGRSEEVLGACSKGWKSKAIIASKCGLDSNDKINLSPKFIQKSVEESLVRMKLERISIYQVTFANFYKYQIMRALEQLDSLKKVGKIGQIGVSVREPGDALRVLDLGIINSVQVTYNLFDVRVKKQVLSSAIERGVGVIVKSPLNKGILTGKYGATAKFSTDDSRSNYLDAKSLINRNNWIDHFCLEIKCNRDNLGEVAIRFLASDPKISTIAIGMHNLDQLKQNLCYLSKGPLSNSELKPIETFSVKRWERMQEDLWNKRNL